jgi:GTPase involved in cell partitioning and DNA repair
MKKLLAALILSFILYSCADPKKQEKDLFTEVIKVHDRVMGKEELIMINKMQLDTLIKENKNPGITATATQHSKALDSADTNMESWMHNFDAEYKGKSHDEIIAYLTDQKKQIDKIDSSFNVVIESASKFIKQNKTK